MSSCDESSIKKNYIVQAPTDFDIFSACTGFYTNNIYNCTGDTLTLHSNTVSANTINSTVYLSGGTNLLDIFGDLDNYTTGATLIGSTAYFDRSDTLSAYTLDLSSLDVNDTFVSGGTYNEGTTSIDFSGNSVETTFTVDLSTMGATFGNTYFVAPEGSDLTGQRGNITLPFQTITGARDKVVGEISASTVTGTTLVYVFPGDYVGDELQYDNGNFYFSPGAKVTSTPRLNANVTSMFVIGGTPLYVSSAYSANVCNVFGSGEFVLSESIDGSPDWGGTIVNVTSSGITYFECYKFHVEQGVGVGVVDSGQATFVGKFLTVDAGYVATVRDYGDAVFNFNRISTEGNGYPFIIRNGSSAGFFGKCIVNAEELRVGSAGGYQAVLIQRLQVGAEIIINADSIISESSYVINSSFCVGGDLTVNGKLFGTRGVHAQLNSGGNFYINGDMETTDGGIDMLSSNGDNFTVIYDGNINVLSGATDGIDLVGGTLKLHGSLTNKDISGTGTTYNGIAKSGGILEIDNFSVFTDNESIVGSGNVTINRTLYIDKPINGGITTSGQYTFTGTTYDGDLNIYNTPTNDNSLTEILGRNSTTGDVEYRDVQSIISAATSQDTFVTGYTYDDANTFTINDNSGSTFSATINNVTGLTVNGGLSATTISACTGIYTSNLYGCSPITTHDRLILLSGLTFSSITKDNSLIQILGRNSTTGDVEYRDVQSIISAATSQDTYVTGFTYDNINTFTINDNSGSTFNASINVLSATTISATTYFGDGSNLSGIDNFYVTGGTYNEPTKEINFTGNSVQTTFDVDLTSLISSVSGDTFVVSGNANAGTSELTFSYNTGGTFTVTNSAALFSDNDINVTGGTYNPSNGCVSFVTNSGTTFDVCGFVTGITDTYTTGSTLVGETIQFDNNIDGLNYYNVSLSPVLSGKTNNVTFNTYTSDTQTILDGKVGDGVNVGSGTGEIFSGKSGTTLNFRTLSGGSNTTLTTIGDVVKIDVAVPSGDNFFSTAGTVTQSATTGDTAITLQIVGTSGFSPYSITGITDTFVNDFTFSSNTFTISQNDGSSFDSSLETIELGNILSAVTFNIGTSGSISATTFNGDTFSGGTYYGDGSNLTGITDNDKFVTGFTYDNSNNLTISRNDGTGFTTNISTMSGLTVNGTLSATTLDGGTILSGGTNLLTIIDDRDTYVTGTTFTGNQSILSRNDGSDVLKISGGTNVTITSGGTNLTVIDVTIPLDNNTFVSGGTYNDSTDIITFTNTSGGTFNVTGITDTFVTGGTYSSGTTSLDFSGNTGFVPFSVNVSELIDDTNTFVTGFTYNDTNTFTISNNNGPNYSASIDVMSGLTVNGNSVFSGTGTDVVKIYGSGDTTPIFSVEGSVGELFSITDSLTGELFAVNNISAQTILSVNSDNTILWGDPNVPSLNTTVKKSINSGLSEIYSIPVSAYTGGFFEYTVTGSGARAGSIMSIFSGTSVDFNETTTNDIGDTSGITFDMNISGGTANLTVSATTNSWEIRTIVRSI